MGYELYADLQILEDCNVFEFISQGKYGNILKRVAFTATLIEDVYNMSLGDVADGNVNYNATTNNGDRNKVLATVANIVALYTARFPQRWIFFHGSTASRTRLYKMAININIEYLHRRYEIWADCGGIILPYAANLATDAFLFKRKR